MNDRMSDLLQPLGREKGKSGVPEQPPDLQTERDNPAFNQLVKKIRKCNEEISVVNSNSEKIRELDQKYKKAANPEKEKCRHD